MGSSSFILGIGKSFLIVPKSPEEMKNNNNWLYNILNWHDKITEIKLT